MDLLTPNDVKALTGYVRPSKQIAWLKRYGVRFFVAADGHPRVLKCDLERPKDQRLTGPDFNALNNMG